MNSKSILILLSLVLLSSYTSAAPITNCLIENSVPKCTVCNSQYYVKDDGTCDDCIADCLECANDTTCKLCDNGKYFDGTSCTSNDACADCYSCAKVDTTVTCQRCVAGYGIQDGKCTQCESGNSPNPATRNCEACGENCLACDFEMGVCTMCKQGYGINNSDDKMACVQDSEAPDCLEPCKTCTAQGYAKCSECIADDGDIKYQKDTLFDGNVCRFKCSTANDKCKPFGCHINEAGDGLACFDCHDGFMAINGECVEIITCARGKYPDYGGSKQCEDCDANCSSCFFHEVFQRSFCNYCEEGFHVQRDVGSCDPKEDDSQPICGHYWGKKGDAESEVCENCSDLNCIDCNDDYSKCNECFEGYELDETEKCKLSEPLKCPLGQYYDEVGLQCEDCEQGCDRCLQVPDDDDPEEFIDVCIDCQSPLVLINGSCVDVSCWEGAVFDKDAADCVDCPDNCSECQTSPTGVECLACFDFYDLDSANNECKFQGSCEDGLIIAGSDKTGQFCAECPPHSGDGSCKYDEASNTIWSMQPCDTEDKDADDKAIVYKVNTKNNLCEIDPGCGAGKYYDIWTQECLECSEASYGAETCYFSSSLQDVQVESCITGFELKGDYCAPQSETSCGKGYYFDEEADECGECVPGCDECSLMDGEMGQEPMLMCDTCHQDFLPSEDGHYCYPNWLIQKTCGAGQYHNYWTNQCEACSAGGECNKCFYNAIGMSPEAICTECDSGFKLINGQCQKVCPARKYGLFNEAKNAATKWTCEKCSPHCQFCDYESSMQTDVCITCSPGYYPNMWGQCERMSLCPNANTYRFLQTDGEGLVSESDICLPCPKECDGCNLIDSSDLFSGFKCKKCSTSDPNIEYTQNSEGTCYDSALDNLKDCKAGEYNKKNGKTWDCTACPTNCGECQMFGDNLICLMCNSGFYFNEETLTCVALDVCPEGQVMFLDGESSYCRPCESIGCKKCTTDDPYNEFYDMCSECDAKLAILDGFCYKNMTGVDDLVQADLCLTGQFPVVIPGLDIALCPYCPDGSVSCHAQNTTDLDNLEIIIDECQPGLRQTETECSPYCDIGEYYVQIPPTDGASAVSSVADTASNSTDAANSTPEPNYDCIPCASDCAVCTGSLPADCNECQIGYIFDKDKNCVAPPELEVTCPPGSEYNSLLDDCQCPGGDTMVYDQKRQQCVDLAQSLGKCAFGEFKDQDDVCHKCHTVPSFDSVTEQCAVCFGPEPDQCVKCATGYFLNDRNQCEACSKNCAECYDKETCLACNKGLFNTYVWSEDGSYLVQVCRSKCFAGQLPEVSSFYELNIQMIPYEIFSSYLENSGLYLNEDDSIYNYLPTSYYYLEQDEQDFKPAVGTDLFRNVYSTSQFPWKMVKGQATYGGAKVELQCEFCLTDCKVCGNGFLLLDDTHECYFDDNCPEGYIRDDKKYNTCQKIGAEDFSGLCINLSESEPGVYRPTTNKNLLISMFASTDEGTTYEFKVLQVQNLKTKKDQSRAYVSSLLNSGDGGNTASISWKKAKPNTVITVQCSATNKGTTVTNSLKIAVKESIPKLKLSDLDNTIKDSDVSITPDSGFTGLKTRFALTGDFNNTLGKKAQTGTYYFFELTVQMNEESDLEDTQQSVYIYKMSSTYDETGYIPSFDFFVPPTIDQPTDLVAEFCIVNSANQLYCTQKTIKVTPDPEFKVEEQCPGTTLDVMAMCSAFNERESRKNNPPDSGDSGPSQGPTSEPTSEPESPNSRRVMENGQEKRLRNINNGIRRNMQNAANTNQTRDLALGFYKTLNTTVVTSSTAATYISTLRKTVMSYVDKTSLSTVVWLVLRAVPFSTSTTILGEITTIVDHLRVNLNILSFKQKRTLELAVYQAWLVLIRNKVDFSTPYLDSGSRLVNLVSFFVDKKVPTAVDTAKGNFRKVWTNTTIPAPTIELSVSLFEEPRIISASVADRSLQKYNKSITSFNVMELHLYTKVFSGKTDFTFSEVNLNTFTTAQDKVCFDMTRLKGSGGNCAWFNETSTYWEGTGCTPSKVVAGPNGTNLEFINCCCGPHNRYALAQTGPQSPSALLNIFSCMFALFVSVILI